MRRCTPTEDLLTAAEPSRGPTERLAHNAWVLRRFVADAAGVVAAIEHVSAAAAPRCMTTPGGRRMSVAMTNCGRAGWVSDARGYRYSTTDPLTGAPWPAMPPVLERLAATAADAAGFGAFAPDVCLINRYAPGTRLSLHRDADERDFTAPIVSVSLGLPVVFLFGGRRRAERPRRIVLEHRDVVVWGRTARLHYHGVAPLADGDHTLLGRCRINLTFRKAR